jgi:DNA-binding transcriptional regulator PaaX
MTFIQDLFEYIKEIGELLPRPFESKYEHIQRLRKSTYYGSLKRLEKKGLILKSKSGRSVSYKITKKGKSFSFSNQQILIKRKDGLLSIITFDIPEYLMKKRRQFRKYLFRSGFKFLQKSVFVSEFELPGNFRDFCIELEIRKFVKVISGKLES